MNDEVYEHIILQTYLPRTQRVIYAVHTHDVLLSYRIRFDLLLEYRTTLQWSEPMVGQLCPGPTMFVRVRL